MKRLSKIICIMLLILSLSLGIVGCSKKDKVEFSFENPPELIRLFETHVIKAVSPNEKEAITYEITDDSILIFEETAEGAKITAIRTGNCTLIAKQGDDSINCTISVIPSDESLVLALTSATSLNLKKGETSDIKPIVTFRENEFAYATIDYDLELDSPSGTVTIDENGRITAAKQGTAKILVKAVCGDSETNIIEINIVVSDPDADTSPDNPNEDLPNGIEGEIGGDFGEGSPIAPIDPTDEKEGEISGDFSGGDEIPQA